MNKQRRTALSAIMDRVEALATQAETLHVEREEITADLEALRDEEQEAFDNLPEGLQQAERGQDAEAAIGELDNALSELEQLDFCFTASDILSSIDNARGMA